jgi:DegV family protein with EDD domain
LKEFFITTDSTCDLPLSYTSQHNVAVMPLYYQLDGTLYGEELKLDDHEFYEQMRSGKMPTTMAVNPEFAASVLEPIVKAGHDVLHIAFSSGLSSSYNSACIAASQLREAYPQRKIVVIDSLCASLGEGLFVAKAVEKRDSGMSIDETTAWLEEHKQNFCHFFTVDDLFHLFRGGRVNRATAILGSLASIKPILHVDHEGHLINIGKVRTRKKSLQLLVDKMELLSGGFEEENKTIFISHGDCEEDARYMADLVKERFGIDSFLINYVSPTIGAHSGPGTLALFFMGLHR